MTTRRTFLLEAPLGLAATLAACSGSGSQSGGTTAATGTPETPGAPPAFNTAPPVGPEVSPATFAEAVVDLLADDVEAERQRRAARAFVEGQTWWRAADLLAEALGVERCGRTPC